MQALRASDMISFAGIGFTFSCVTLVLTLGTLLDANDQKAVI
jgi:hypothetical protein